MQHDYRTLAADVVRTYHAIWRGGTFVAFGQAFAALEVALMDTSNPHWPFETDQNHGEPFPLPPRDSRDNPMDVPTVLVGFPQDGPPEEPSDTEPGERPGDDNSTVEATTLWIAGYMRKDSQWEFVGVFSHESLAACACKDERYFVAPALLDRVTPEETTTWPGAYFPKVEVVA